MTATTATARSPSSPGRYGRRSICRRDAGVTEVDIEASVSFMNWRDSDQRGAHVGIRLMGNDPFSVDGCHSLFILWLGRRARMLFFCGLHRWWFAVQCVGAG